MTGIAERQVGDAHQDLVDPASAEARPRIPRSAPHDHRDQRRERRDAERRAAAVEHAGEQVATELVGAEQVRERGRREEVRRSRTPIGGYGATQRRRRPSR